MGLRKYDFRKIVACAVAICMLDFIQPAVLVSQRLLAPPQIKPNLVSWNNTDNTPISPSDLPDDIFNKLYLSNVEGFTGKIKNMIDAISQINFGLYKTKIQPLFRGAREVNKAEAIKILNDDEDGTLDEIFPFLRILSQAIDARTFVNAKTHTLEVFDAFDRLVRNDFEKYNNQRIETCISANGPIDEIEDISADDCGGLNNLIDQIYKTENKELLELFFLLPFIHDVGKVVIAKGHPEIGAKYFVEPILKMLKISDENINLARKLVEKHVDLSTLVTTERTPLYMLNGIKNPQELTMLTLLSIADRSYGFRAADLTKMSLKDYLEWGNRSSARWDNISHWEINRFEHFVTIKTLKAVLKDALNKGIAVQDDVDVFREYMGKKITVFDYGKAVFEQFVKKDKTGMQLLKLFIVLSKIAHYEDSKGADIFRINLIKEKNWVNKLYAAIEHINVKLSAEVLKDQIGYTVRGGKFLDINEIDSRNLAAIVYSKMVKGLAVSDDLRELTIACYEADRETIAITGFPSLENINDPEEVLNINHNKYDKEGNPLRFPGNTTVANIKDHPLSHLFRMITGDRENYHIIPYIGDSGINSINYWQIEQFKRKILGTVKHGSEHVTIYDLLCVEDWEEKYKKQLNEETKNAIDIREKEIASLKKFNLGKNAKEQAAYEIFYEKVNNLLKQFTAVRSPKFKPVGISAFPPHFVNAGKSLLILSMAPVSAEDLAIVNRLQDEIRAETGLNNFGAYKAHITLGYFISRLKNKHEYTIFRQYLNQLDAYIKTISDNPEYHFTFPSIELCEFQNMEQYDTVEDGSYPWVKNNITSQFVDKRNSQKPLEQSH